MSESKPHVTIYTDGACLGNPGPGGYGAVLLYGEHRREIHGGFQLTTNNRMEMIASIRALESLKRPCRVTLYTDSEYLRNPIEKGWAERWRRKGWMRNSKERAKNSDLWARLLELCATHDVEFQWVRGHAGNPENERCDALAVEAAQGAGLEVDAGYEDDQRLGDVQSLL